jgi:hypothetical protein
MSRLLDLILSPLWRLLVWLDVQINDKWLGGGRETISSRCYRKSAAKKSKCLLCCWLCRALDKIDPMHCEMAYYSARAQNPNLPEPD